MTHRSGRFNEPGAMVAIDPRLVPVLAISLLDEELPEPVRALDVRRPQLTMVAEAEGSDERVGQQAA